MISIDGLSKKQIAMLNIIWNCNGEEQFLEWFCTLPHEDKLTAESLMQCLAYEVLEGLLDGDFTEANDILKRFNKNGNV